MIMLMTSQSLETRWTKQQQQTQANSMPADDGAKLGGTSWGSVGICTSDMYLDSNNITRIHFLLHRTSIGVLWRV